MAATATVLLATMQGGGTVPPTMAVARRLVERGHRVHVLSEPTVADEAAAAGCSFAVWPTAPFADATNRDRTTGRDWEVRNPAQALRLVRDLTDFIFGAAGRYAADVLATLDRVPADAVVLEPMILGAVAAAERSGLPTVGLVPNTYLRPTPGRPVMGSGWLPGDGPLVRVRDRVAPALFERVVDLGLRRLNAVRAELGLHPLRHVFDTFDRCTRLLVMTSPSFDPPPARLPPNVRFVGPMLDDPAWAGPVSLPPGDDPLVLVAMSSTYQAQQGDLQRVVRALAGLPVRGVVTLGPSLRDGEVAGAPNVVVVPSAPHSEILKTAAAVVTHGGHGTVIKALAAGVPVVCLPHGRDQGDNAARVVAAGAGLRLSRRADEATIRSAVRRLLDSPVFRRNAGGLAQRIAAELRETSAVEEIEQVIGRV